MYIRVKNVSPGPVSIWWGETNFNIPSNHVAAIPHDAFEASHKIRALEGTLESVGSPFHATSRPPGTVDAAIYEAQVKVAEAEAKKNEAAPTPVQPWEDPTWDAYEAPIEEVKNYADVHHLAWDDADEENNRNVVAEHRMETAG